MVCEDTVARLCDPAGINSLPHSLNPHLLKCIIDHSFIFYTTYSIVGHRGAGAYLHQSMGKRQGTPWTGRKSIAGQHRDIQDKQPCTHSFTPLPCSKKVLDLTPSWGSFCMEFACSPRACMGSHRVLWLPPTVRKRDC
ncbi:hypothetical protein CHARACLAT_021607 [Characodon lateralis]|uniref:Uncharacterized protein n=1 Tax=Characodon lateralis TaxID=208331 RepID=A0ABU7E2Q8_9TELE|nr:hypothetical protein [Characodon lateralis]